MSNPELLLEQYQKIIDGHSTESIKEGQQALLKLERSSSFVADNAAILYQPKITVLVKKFTALYLANYSKRLIKDKSIGKCQGTIQQYLAIISHPTLEIDIKVLFVNAIEVLLNCEHFKAVKMDFSKEYVRLINEAVGKEDNSIDFVLLVLCGQSIFVKESYSEQAKEIIKVTILSLLQIIQRLVNLATSQSLQNRNLFLTIIRVLKEYSILLKLYFKKLMLLDIESMKVLYLQELEQLLSSVLALNYKQNCKQSSIFIQIQGEQLLSKLINIMKANFIAVMTSAVRNIITFTKHPNLLATNPLFQKVPQILTMLIKSTSFFLREKQYYRHNCRIMLLETLDQVFNFLISSLRVNSFYLNFFDNKLELLQQIILPCLSLTPKDIDNFYEDSDEFVQNTLQVVNRNLMTLQPNPAALSNEDPSDEIQQFQTLRTLAAEFLNAFCKYQDGTLSHVVDFALGVLTGKHQGDKTLMFLVISILCTHFKDRKDLNTKVMLVIIDLIEKCPIPVVTGTRKLQDLQYGYLLLTLSKLFFYSIEIYPNIVNLSFKVGVAIIQSPSCSDVHKYFVFDLFNHLAKIQEASMYARDLLSIYNHILKNMQTPSIHLLDSYFLLIKYNPQEFKKCAGQLIEGMQHVCTHIQREINKPQPTQILLSKEWNIIREVGQSQDFIPALIQPLEELIMPLLTYIDGTRNVNYEEDILMLLTYFNPQQRSFIDKGKRVSANQQRMFQIIPKIFYNQYACRFGHSFHTLQLFIYYGSEVLNNNLAAVKAIIEMGLTSISTLEYNRRPMAENQNCQGALVLQSLVLKCGASFTPEIWSTIIKAVVKRLDETEIRFHLLSSNLYALLSIALIHSHKFFSNEENEILMAKILSQMRVFSKVQYSPKIIIAGLTELLVLSECDFINRRFTQILDTVITMLEITSSKRESYFNQQQDEQEKEYSNSIIMLKNDLKNLDEFAFFRQQVEKLKLKDIALLQKSVKELPKAKKDFFSHILRIQRVANEPRQIYRIKR